MTNPAPLPTREVAAALATGAVLHGPGLPGVGMHTQANRQGRDRAQGLGQWAAAGGKGSEQQARLQQAHRLQKTPEARL